MVIKSPLSTGPVMLLIIPLFLIFSTLNSISGYKAFIAFFFLKVELLSYLHLHMPDGIKFYVFLP